MNQWVPRAPDDDPADRPAEISRPRGGGVLRVTVTVEDCLNAFLAQVYVRAEVLRERHAGYERTRQELQEQERLRREAADRAQDE